MKKRRKKNRKIQEGDIVRVTEDSRSICGDIIGVAKKADKPFRSNYDWWQIISDNSNDSFSHREDGLEIVSPEDYPKDIVVAHAIARLICGMEI